MMPLPSPRLLKSPDLTVRLIGGLPGRYALPRLRYRSSSNVFACRATSISPHQAVLSGPVCAEIGDEVTAYFAEFGLVAGQVSRRIDSGFEMKIEASDDERRKYAATIEWLRRRRLQSVPDQRQHKRLLPRQPHSTLILASGQVMPCFVIDMSVSGAAISADLDVAIGTPLAVGAVIGRVVRLRDVGFAIKFGSPQAADSLELNLIKPLAPARQDQDAF